MQQTNTTEPPQKSADTPYRLSAFAPLPWRWEERKKNGSDPMKPAMPSGAAGFFYFSKKIFILRWLFQKLSVYKGKKFTIKQKPQSFPGSESPIRRIILFENPPKKE